MRNTIKSFAALLIVLSAVKSNANTDSTTVGTYCKVVAQEKEDSYKLIYQGNKKANVTIQWLDNASHVLYSENLKSSDRFIKQYDLATLSDGDYTVKVIAGDYEFSKEVILGESVGLKLSLRALGDKKVLLTGYPDKPVDYTVVVIDDQNKRIFEQSVNAASIIQKKFVFEQIDSKSVTFVIYSKGKIVTEETIVL